MAAGGMHGAWLLAPTLPAFNWESHRKHTNSTSWVLKSVRDLIGVRAAADGEDALQRAVQLCKRG